MSRRNWRGGGFWPFLYMQQPGGWAEQSFGQGFGQRPNRANGLFSPCSVGNNNNNNNNDNSNDNTDPCLDSLSNLFTRLILQNHLTRLAGDVVGRGGGLWGCSLPSPAASPSCSTCHPQSHSHSHNQGCGGSNNSSSINMCGHTNNINMACMCHTCPAATRPYMGANNVFVIPTGCMQQQQQQHSSLGNPNVSGTNLNMFLNGLGLAMGTADNGCGGGVNSPAGGFAFPVLGGGMGGPLNHNGANFFCRSCNFQMM